MSLVRRDLSVGLLRELVQDAHLSFLIGAGASAPMFRVLGDIENLLTLVDAAEIDNDTKAFARASVYATFFKSVVLQNRDLLAGSGEAPELLKRYSMFLQTINRLLLQRRSSILNKQVNIFTTNVDLATEVAAESLQLHLNDGFVGRLSPRFSTSNFGSVLSRRSLQYDNLSEIPTFNLLKLHGSVSWSAAAKAGEGERPEITLDGRLDGVGGVAAVLEGVDDLLAKVDWNTTLDDVVNGAVPQNAAEVLAAFNDRYGELAIVNPTKVKFQQTVLNQNYYDLLRLFSNELEKENSILFVIGFSCRDEHIRELMVRAARSNPTLQIVIFAYHADSASDIEAEFDGNPITNSNIWLVAPPVPAAGSEGHRYDLSTIVAEYFDNIVPAPPSPQQTVETQVAIQDPLIQTDD